MKYFNSYHKEKTERCLQKMKSWYPSPMTSEEHLKTVQEMKDNFTAATSM